MDNTKKSSGSSRVGILDELRGFAIICMVVYHAMYDLKYLFGLDIPIFFDGWFDVIRDIFAGLFIFISGTVCRYSSNNIKRGAQCFFIGMIMTFVMPFFTSGTVMFGILHFLGVSMMLFGLGQKLFDLLPSWVGIGVCVLLFILTMNVRLTYANGVVSPGYIGIPNLFAIKLPMEAYNVPAGTSQRIVQFLGLLPDDALVLPVPRGKLLRNHRKGGKATEVLLPDPHQMARCGRQVYHMDIRSPSAGSLWNFQPYVPSLTLPEKRILTYPGWRTSIFCLHINVGF